MNFELFYFMTEYSNIEQKDLVPDKEKTKKKQLGIARTSK